MSAFVWLAAITGTLVLAVVTVIVLVAAVARAWDVLAARRGRKYPPQPPAPADVAGRAQLKPREVREWARICALYETTGSVPGRQR